DFMPRAFMVVPDSEPQVFANTDTEDLSQFVAPFDRVEQQKRNASDRYEVPTPESRFARFTPVNAENPDLAEVASRIIPKPLSVTTRRGFTEVDGKWQIHSAGRLTSEANYLQERLSEILGATVQSTVSVKSTADKIIVLQVGSDDRRLPVP